MTTGIGELQIPGIIIGLIGDMYSGLLSLVCPLPERQVRVPSGDAGMTPF
jgi:hypothetical protein